MAFCNFSGRSGARSTRFRRAFVALLALCFAAALWLAHQIQPEEARPTPRVLLSPTRQGSAVRQSTIVSHEQSPGGSEATTDTKTEALNGEAAKEQLRKNGQYETLGAAFQAARYAVEKIDPAGPHSRGAGYFATNPKQQLRAWFGNDGIELASGRARGVVATPSSKEPPGDAHLDRTRITVSISDENEQAQPWNVSLRLHAAGRTNALGKVGASEVRTRGSRVEMIDSAIGLTQWFENRTEGIEQGFTITAPPPGSGPLEVVMSVDGTLRPEPLSDANASPQGIRFVDPHGAEVLHYTALEAWDSTGRPLPARMEVRGADLAFVIMDAKAHYPVTIDPLFSSAEARLVENPFDRTSGFGNSVVVDGDTAIVGANLEDTPAGGNVGSAYVFVRSGTNWTLQARLTANDGASPDQFGFGLALSGNTAVIGAPNDNASGTTVGSGFGSAYIFQRSGGLWSQEAKLTASDGAAGDLFGTSVAISGDTILVGAYGDDTVAGPDAGSAYVFIRNGAAWNQQAKLESFVAAGEFFGISVSLSGDTALIGAPFDSNPALGRPGHAYIFIRSGTTWSAVAQARGFSTNSTDQFGRSVALSDTTALIGANSDNTPISNLAGSAYVFVRSGNIWSFQQQLFAADGGLAEQFGFTVSLSGETALVGAFGETAPGGAATGSAYVFVRSGGSWSQQAKLNAGDSEGGDLFGGAVSLSGDTALIGATFADTPGGADTGAGYVFARSGASWSSQEKLVVVENGSAGDFFGTAVALDDNTALIGAPADDTAVALAGGKAYVFVRSGALWSLQASLTPIDGFTFNCGRAVALSGNTAVIGGFERAYIFSREGLVWTQQQILANGPDFFDEGFGAAVAVSGDTALVGAAGLAQARGAAYVYSRNGASWNLQQFLFAADGVSGDLFGAKVALDGDTAVIGTSLGRAAAYVFARNGTTWSPQQILQIPRLPEVAQFVLSVALDKNTALLGSFFEDTVVGSDTGSVRVFVREEAGWSQQAVLTAGDAEPGDGFGGAVSVSGDIALIGAPFDDTSTGRNAGSAYVFERQAGVWIQQTKITAELNGAADDNFAGAVALDGDTALIAAAGNDSAGTDAGTAFTYRLGEIPAVTVQPVSRTVVPGVPVTFSVAAVGDTPLRYQWRRNGLEIEGANGPSLTIQVPPQSPFDAFEGTYDVIISNIGGVATSAVAILQVNALSEFAQQPPAVLDPRPGAQGFLVVNLSPGDLNGRGWRFLGEQQWRAPGVPVGGLASGNREIEFRPVPGYLHPLQEPVSIVSGHAATVVEREYFPSADLGTGTLNVTLLPASLGGAQWRLLGEGDGAWRNSGVALSGLAAGVYLVECREVTGYATPRPRSVTVEAGATGVATVTYFLKDAAVGAQPGVVGFEAITGAGPNPYTFVGQLRSDSGAGTGFVVRRRVVATAAHVVFDDGALSAATGLQWLFQREQGTYEPVAQIPRGAYILAGYAAQRTTDGTPGESSAASQNLDAASVWFYEEDAARGGFGGYLASDATDNEWLLSPRLKTLVGYPLDDIAPLNQGRMHATPPTNIVFTHTTGRVYLTDGLTSRGGNSGGPVMVQYDDGNYYPAAVYLGGTTQTRVRVIDSDVITLFDSAEESSNTGQNSTNGGIPQLNSSAGAPASATLVVNLEPAGARNAGAGWRIGSGGFLASGQAFPFLSPGSYTVTFKAIPGYVTPSPRNVNLTPTSLPVVMTYLLAQVPVITTDTQFVRAIRGHPFNFTVEATGGPTRFIASGLSGTNLAFDETTGVLSGTPNANGTFEIFVVAENSVGSSIPVKLTIVVSDPRKLVVQADPERGRVEVSPRRAGNIFPQGEKVTLTAVPDRPGFLFANWEFTGAIPKSFTQATTSFRMGEEEIVIARANFVPNPFLSLRGEYIGLLGEAAMPTGRLRLMLRSNGGFNLRLKLGARHYGLDGGKFDLDGNFTGEVTRSGKTALDVTLHLDLSGTGPAVVAGSIIADGVTHDLNATLAGFDETNPAPKGRYTLALAPDPTQNDPATFPQGYGYALITVDRVGTVRAVGKLGDGQSFTAGGRFAADQRWLLYVQPYGDGKKGLLGGVITFTDTTAPAIDELHGALHWQKPAANNGRYPAGFEGDLTAIGSRYTAPQPGTAALDITDWNLVIGTGVLPTPVLGTASLDNQNRFTLGGAAASITTLKLDSETGLLHGSVILGSDPAAPFKGVLLQSQRQGRGVLVLPDRTAPVTLDPL